MNTYLEPDHPDAFIDWPEQQPPTEWYPKRTIPCPVCAKHGG
jgi:hypothetical protein